MLPNGEKLCRMQHPSEYAQRSPSGRLLQPWAETTWPGLLSSCSPATSDTQLESVLSRDESRLVKCVLKCQHHLSSQKQRPAWPCNPPLVLLKSQLFLFYWFCLLTDGATTTNSKEDKKNVPRAYWTQTPHCPSAVLFSIPIIKYSDLHS